MSSIDPSDNKNIYKFNIHKVDLNINKEKLKEFLQNSKPYFPYIKIEGSGKFQV